MYSLWHIPSSTLLLTSARRDEIDLGVRNVLCEGIPLDELMVQFTGQGELIGHQHLGLGIADVLLDPASVANPCGEGI